LGLTAVVTGSPATVIARAAPPSQLLSQAFVTHHRIVSVYVTGGGQTSDLHLSLEGGLGQKIEPQGAVPAPASGRPVWRRVNFSAPAGSYQLAVSHDGPGWFAVTQPFTDTPLSRLAEKLTHDATLVFVLAGIAVAATLICAGRRPGCAT
jgi:hypothetical protein